MWRSRGATDPLFWHGVQGICSLELQRILRRLEDHCIINCSRWTRNERTGTRHWYVNNGSSGKNQEHSGMHFVSTTYQLSGPRRAFAPRFAPCSVKDGDMAGLSLAARTGKGFKAKRNSALKLATLVRARRDGTKMERSVEQIEDAVVFIWKAASCLLSLMMGDSPMCNSIPSRHYFKSITYVYVIHISQVRVSKGSLPLQLINARAMDMERNRTRTII